MGRIIAAPCAALRFPLDYGLDVFLAADSQNPFIIDIYILVDCQFIPDPLSHIRMFSVDVLDPSGNLLVSQLARAYGMLKPTVICRAGDMKTSSETFDRIMLFFWQFLDRLIFKKMVSQR